MEIPEYWNSWNSRNKWKQAIDLCVECMSNSPCEDQGSELRYANTIGLLWTTEQGS